MNKDFKWNGEVILADALDNVLKNLNAKDLSNAAQVCKSWSHAVKLEFSRRGPERITIPNPDNPVLQDSEFRVANFLSTKPNVVLLLCGPGPHSRRKLDVEASILNAYNNQFPVGTKLIVLGIEKVIKDGSEVLSCPTNHFDKSDIFGILGVALPNYRNINIEVAYCESYEKNSQKLAKQVMEQLMPDDSNQKSVLIVFGRSHYTTCEKVVELIKNTYKSGTYTLWGCTTPIYLKIIECQSGDFPSYLGMQGVVCVRITGEALEAHTTVLSRDLTIPEVIEKLSEFKSKVKLRRHKLGLLCAACFCHGFSNPKVKPFNCNAAMKEIKRVFPDIPFTSFFNEHFTDHSLGMDSTSEDPNQELMHPNKVSIMILTYD